MKRKRRTALTTIFSSMLALLAACGAEPDIRYTDALDFTEEPYEENYTVTPSAASSVTTETFENADFSILIPQNWTVTTGGTNIYHSIHIADPDEPLNQMFVLLKADILLHSQEGKNAWQKLYQSGNTQASLFAEAPVLEAPSTEGFFQIFSDYTDFVSRVESSYNGYTFPQFQNFTVLDSSPCTGSLASTSINDALLHATFTDQGREGEGMFSASIVDVGRIDISDGSLVGYQLQTVDGGYYAAYTIVAMTSVKDSFIDWEGVLMDCMKSLQYSDSFVNATKSASDAQVSQSIGISQNFNQIMDAMMASWENRNTTQDILSQKQSDAILGYERVYDTETGEIYKATNGFTDAYDGKRYLPVTDDAMYTQPVYGYIEKVD